MNVGEFKKRLEGISDDTAIILSRDEEGNGFGPLDSVEKMVYIPDWGEVRYPPEATENGCDPEDCYDGDDGVKALVLWP